MQNQIFDNYCEYRTPDKFDAELSNSAIQTITIVHVNIVSLPKNYDALKIFLGKFSKKFDVLCLSESRLNDRNLKYCNIPGYSMYFCNSATRAGGAVIFVRNNLNCRQLTETKIKADECEDVWVDLKLNKSESLTVGSVYRHPTTDMKRFEDAFVHVIKRFKANQNYIILGDFNINYDKKASSQNVNDYANNISSIGCLQLIDKPTRTTPTSSTIIDYIYVNTALTGQVLPIILYDDISDHFPLCAELRYTALKKSTMRPIFLPINQKVIELFLSKLNKELNIAEKRNNNNLDNLISIMSDSTNLCCPKKTMSRKQYKVSKSPWITTGILTSIKQKNKLYAKYIKTKNSIIFEEYKKYRNKVTHVKEAAKRNYFQMLFEGSSNSSDT